MSNQRPGASAAGEPETGWQLARRCCAGYRVVDMRWVRAWLGSPHPPMPNMNLSHGEIDDVIAYLDTLAKR